MTTKAIDQKEYLKKYLSGKDKDKKKKKKRRSKIIGEGLKIIDDDIDLSQLDTLEENEIDLFNSNEDAPQIAGVVDERDPSIKTLSDYQSNSKWKALDNQEDSARKLVDEAGDNDNDASPPRRNKSISADISPPRRKSKRYSDSDNSPPRLNSNKNVPDDSDNSPVRQRGSSPRRKFRASNSPSRKPGAKERYRGNSRDLSPPRRRNGNSDRNSNYSRDSSPPRRSNFTDDWSRDRRTNRDYSARPMHGNSNRDSFRSRSPRNNYSKNITRIRSPERRNNSSRRSVDSRENSFDNNQRVEDRGSSNRTQKMSTTLDGKMAGLQDAKSLQVESESFRKKENTLFQLMNEEQSGRNASTVVRDRKTGRRRDLDREKEEDNEKQERNKVRKEKYSRWGKGLKQVEEREARLQTDAHEMSKPLARYADDRDLEQHLRDQFHTGDPMLEYMQRKDMENKVKKGIEVKPLYKGSYPPNRFDIRPGYRWDGVDRSVGYEKKYFEAINSKKALDEEAYKWSTEDM